MRGYVLTLALVLATVGPASAASLRGTCDMAHAVYRQPESGFELHFHPVAHWSRVGGTSEMFRVRVPGFAPELEGMVVWNNGESRPNGSVMLACPSDAMTDEDFADCTLWDGVIYGVGDDTATLLPDSEEAMAPRRILLPDFGRKIRYSALFYDWGIEEVPFDVFELSGCAVGADAPVCRWQNVVADGAPPELACIDPLKD